MRPSGLPTGLAPEVATSRAMAPTAVPIRIRARANKAAVNLAAKKQILQENQTIRGRAHGPPELRRVAAKADLPDGMKQTAQADLAKQKKATPPRGAMAPVLILTGVLAVTASAATGDAAAGARKCAL